MDDRSQSDQRIGPYRVIRHLATGGASDLLLAQGFDGQFVVLKLLQQQFRENTLYEKMLVREAAAYGRLSHPAIVKLFDFFRDGDKLVLVLEFVDGLALNRLRSVAATQNEVIEDNAALYLGTRLFSALAAAHGARDPESGEFAPVVHRDVNPSNLLVPWDGQAKLADFGIATVAGMQGDTQSGNIKGTFGYMAPEQVRGDAVTIRADIYAGALVVWELLARKRAFDKEQNEVDLLRAMGNPIIESLDALRSDLAPAVREAIRRALEPIAERRSITAEEIVVAFRNSGAEEDGRHSLVGTLSRIRARGGAEAATIAPATGSRPSLKPLTPFSRTPPPLPVRTPAPSSAKDVIAQAQAMSNPQAAAKDLATNEPATNDHATKERLVPESLAPISEPMSRPMTLGLTIPLSQPTPVITSPPPPVVTKPNPSVPVLPDSVVITPPPRSSPEPLFLSPALNDVRERAKSPKAKAKWFVPLTFVGAAVAVAVAVVWMVRSRQSDSGPVPVASTVIASDAVNSIAKPGPANEPPPQKVVPAATLSAEKNAPPPAASSIAAATPLHAPALASAKSAPPSPVAPPPPPTKAPPHSTATTGVVRTGSAPKGHRVFVDGQVVGQTPGSFTVRCGGHQVRVGSRGSTQFIQVPCGGEVDVRAR